MARSYQDIVPDCQYEEGEAQDVIEFQLKDFKKDQLKVHFGSNGVILVSGERPVEGGKWIRFRKEFAIPKDCKATEIRARFSSGFLYVTIPKKAVSSDVSQQGPLTPVQQAATGTPSSPVQDKGKLKQENSVGRSGDVDDECSACSTAENAVSPTPRPEWSIWRLKMEGKTAVTSGASLVMAAAGLMFVVLYYAFKYYDPVNKTV
ncbi:hypothetical protein F3Y22_tig00002684pilonHSYRG00041 [Hibiscus syriacus]|uniref:SHSP domain-containing protein n=1 Tax=Hibiscus syriacus TaxID=106335 RepID=A0A6A3CWQ5_HIBSY|nr:inactive protein RESTRICTED TEV MOVEMENT 2-like [Hibiscus syriacus]KAE8731728.1 hypothetical protein F3Y22_tig00002684pilonHSYRG00041 [Hibiscus syriacus]